jgi:hypothetical protein
VAELADALDSKAGATLESNCGVCIWPLFRIRLLASDRLPAKKGWLLNRARIAAGSLPSSQDLRPSIVLNGNTGRVNVVLELDIAANSNRI